MLEPLQIWKHARSRVSFSGILRNDPASGEPLLVSGSEAAETIRDHWAEVFRAREVHPHAEDQLLMHTPVAQLPTTDLSDGDFTFNAGTLLLD